MARQLVAVAIALVVLGCTTAPSPPVSSAPATAIPPECTEVRQPDLCAELIALRDRDQAARRKWLADRDNAALQQEVDTVDRENVSRVREIIDSMGWPGKSVVGEKGSGAAWTILQHSDVEVLKRSIDVMQRAVDAGELPGGLFATSVDRTRVQDGRPQVYGTQFHEVDGKMVPLPIENEAEVDARRARVGLQPLAEYAALMNQVYAQQKKP